MAIASIEDQALLQEDLNRIYSWANVNNLQFNDLKFELLQYGENVDLKQQFKYVSSTGEAIQPTKVVKDLGILMSNA